MTDKEQLGFGGRLVDQYADVVEFAFGGSSTSAVLFLVLSYQAIPREREYEGTLPSCRI